MFGAGDEVGEGVLLLGRAPIKEPAPALFRAAANMGRGPDPAAINQRQVADREVRLHRNAIGPVAIEQQGRRPIQRRGLAHQHRHRHLNAIRSRGIEAAGDIVGGVVARRYLLGLAKGAAALGHVIVKPLFGRGRGLIDKTHSVGVVLIAARKAEREGLFVKGDGMLSVGTGLGDDQAVIGIFTHQPHEPASESADTNHELTGHVAAPVFPIGLTRRAFWGLDDLEINGPVGIGADQEPVVPVLGLVLHPSDARL